MKPGSHFLNLIWALSEKVITILLTLVTTAAIARYFGVEVFGAYQFAMSVLFVATSLTWLCPAEALFSKVRPNGTIDNSVIVTSIIYRFIVSLIVWFGVFIYAWFSVESDVLLAFILILTITLVYSEPLGIFRFILECQGYYHLTARIRLFSLTFKVVLVLLFIYCDFSPQVVIGPVIFESMLLSLCCIYFALRFDKSINITLSEFDKKIALDFIFDGLKLWFGLVCMNIFLKLDRLLLQNSSSADIFGYYAASFSFMEQILSLSAMIFAVLGPILIYRSSTELLKENTLKLAFIMFLVGLLSALISYYLSSYLISLIYGEDYAESVEIFRAFAFIIPFVFLDTALNAYIIKNKSSLYFTFKWLSALVTSYLVITFNLSEYGWVAAGYGYCAGFIMAVVISLVYLLRRSKYVAVAKNQSKKQS
ncbi:oligosaccharide flippase family protein [Shewanella sp. NIFS-20-20]|uniref:oligosaccharide flippase family protein n=1 Tax=Shewanella sp. NIFS-20-20 TaxID=2853806 RepID=UPI001C48C143|nr:oligosaccharide flippase family protein [Shewanella sp. NIFS-20-20]MBV7314834.1 oligosaccharide flippase family protein [Shewanella sp. NIFS-20-20]